jgi:hypothetical protein
VELVHHRRYATQAEAKTDIFEYIETPNVTTGVLHQAFYDKITEESMLATDSAKTTSLPNTNLRPTK